MSGKTRRRTVFKGSATRKGTSRTNMAVTGELKDMLKSLLEERKTLEAELREERKVRAEEAAKRDEAMREQMELLRGLVCVGTGVGARSGGGGVTRTVPLEPKVVKLTD